MDDKKHDKSKGQRPSQIPAGREEERRGNDDPTYPDLMGPYPERPSTQGTVLGKDEASDRKE